MRCEDLTRELASPTGALDSARMAEHLAACPACAEWSRRARQLDRIWEATRPAGPSMDAMDALWARVAGELDGRKVPATLEFARPATLKLAHPARPRRRAMVGLLVAQAAALLLVAGVVLLRRDGAGPIPVAAREVAEEPTSLDLMVENDEIAVVRLGLDNKLLVVERDDQSDAYRSPSLPTYTPHDEFDKMEVKGATLGVVASFP